MLDIFVDADACPVKKEVYRVASRCSLKVTLVANSWMRVPHDRGIVFQLVGSAADAADDWIVEHVQPHDIVVTSDVPLASHCLKKGAGVISPKGKIFTEDNIGQTVAMRDLLTELRGAGERTGGPPPLTQRDRSIFLQRLDEAIQSARSDRKRKEI
ncbi:MAG: YaiI/YqxD family protein [Kiritimatiellae bacterium]|nr:YaiI/YqxD family protein [Kiritimatiellia bacterium]